MDRAWRRYGYLLAITALLTVVGCATPLATALWALGYSDIPAEFDGLKGKNVAIVCRPVTSLHYQDSHVARDLAAELGKLLHENNKKVVIVDPRKVERWCDENSWEEFLEVGKAVKADVVVGIDLEEFEMYQGQTLYQGRASVTLRVYDCKDGKVLFEKTPPQCVYPPNACIATSEKSAPQFRREFIKVLAGKLGMLFYAHDPWNDMAEDARAL
jgi:hypothetical protein